MKNNALARPLFPLGRLLSTSGAMDLMTRTRTTVSSLLRRQSCGDWGIVDESDKRANDLAVTNGTRILSAYALGPGQEKLWLITGADRSATTFLTPCEY
jgi:hypothetical protein